MGDVMRSVGMRERWPGGQVVAGLPASPKKSPTPGDVNQEDRDRATLSSMRGPMQCLWTRSVAFNNSI
jgi:hypothetical protein